MALIFCDGFDHYATAQLLEKWSSSSGGANIVSGGREGQGCHVNGYLNKNLPSNASSLIMGSAFNQTTIGNTLFRFYDSTGNGQSQCSVICNSNGSLSVLDHNNTVLGTSASGIVYANLFQYLEAKITFATSGRTKADVCRRRGRQREVFDHEKFGEPALPACLT